jgi:putative phosphoesterase
MIRTSTLVGIISDTHGLLRPAALKALRGCHVIVHAGDVGTPAVLEGLRKIAPTVAIRGNNDKGAWASTLPETTVVEASGVSLYVLHDLNSLDLDPATAGFQAVIAGHSHRPRIENRQGVLFVNPGSAGPRRFKLPVAVARLRVSRAKKVEAEVMELKSEGAGSLAAVKDAHDVRTLSVRR